jgi:hypothetical protein
VAIYLDHNATTPIAPEVREAMRPYLEERFGNPSSAHEYGRVALEGVERARAEVAALLRCDPDSIVFTASGSEADNLAIKGVAMYLLGEGDHIITSAIEHPAVLGACRYLERRLGYRLTILPVDEFGATDPEEVRRAIEPGTVLVCRGSSKRLMGLEPTTFCMASRPQLHGRSRFLPANRPLLRGGGTSFFPRVSLRFDGIVSPNCPPEAVQRTGVAARLGRVPQRRRAGHQWIFIGPRTRAAVGSSTDSGSRVRRATGPRVHLRPPRSRGAGQHQHAE